MRYETQYPEKVHYAIVEGPEVFFVREEAWEFFNKADALSTGRIAWSQIQNVIEQKPTQKITLDGITLYAGEIASAANRVKAEFPLRQID